MGNAHTRFKNVVNEKHVHEHACKLQYCRIKGFRRIKFVLYTDKLVLEGMKRGEEWGILYRNLL